MRRAEADLLKNLCHQESAPAELMPVLPDQEVDDPGLDVCIKVEAQLREFRDLGLVVRRHLLAGVPFHEQDPGIRPGEDVRHGRHAPEDAARLQHAQGLPHEADRPQEGDVLDHVLREDRVHRAVVESQALGDVLLLLAHGGPARRRRAPVAAKYQPHRDLLISSSPRPRTRTGRRCRGPLRRAPPPPEADQYTSGRSPASGSGDGRGSASSCPAG